MAKLVVETEDFSLEFETSNFKMVLGKAKSNIPNKSLHSFYAVEGVSATVKLDAPELLTPPGPNVIGILNPGENSREDGHAFFFDNVEYSVWFEPKGHCKNAQVRHFTKLVEKELSRHGRVLYGTVDTGNDVGRRDFAFSYERTVNGVTTACQFVFTAEVLSQKLDYHQDWRTLVEEIEDRYPMLAYDFLKRTYHAFEKSYDENEATNLVWWNLFDRLQRPFVKACRLVIERPKRRLRGDYEYRRADQLKVLTPQLENEFAEFKSAASHLYRVARMADTHDTPENRFVKYALRSIYARYVKLHNAILRRDDNRSQHKLSDTAKASMNAVESELRQLVANPFFRRIGPFMGFRQLSLTLQRAPGYATIYRMFAILNAAYMIHEGQNKMETKDIAELYEIWCFLKVEEFTEKALPPGTVKNPSGIKGDDFVKLLSTGLQSTVVFRSTTGVELARVVYNPEIKDHVGSKPTGVDGTITPTTISNKSSQDPDIVLRLTNSDVGGYQVTYLFDAKYRMEDIKGSHVGAPPQDAIDQMHRYRDAIYYSDANQSGSLEPFAYKKEIVGGYILFPGKGKIALEPPESGMPDNRPQYIKSIDKVNIGALPLRPNDQNNADILERFIAKLVAGTNDLDAVLGRVNPQKGSLLPVATASAINDATVYGTYHGKKQLAWIRQYGYYNLPLDAAKTLGITPTYANKKRLLALLPPGQNPTEELLVFQIDEQVACKIVSKDELIDPNGPYKYNGTGSRAPYLVWKLKSTEPITKRVPRISIISNCQAGVARGALEAAEMMGLEFGGWAPYSWVAEDGAIPAQFHANMQECASTGSAIMDRQECVKANVRDSGAVLILTAAFPLTGDAKLAKDASVLLHRSHTVLNLESVTVKDDAIKWLRQFIGASVPVKLAVFGSTEVEQPHVTDKTKQFLSEILWEL